MIGVSSLIPFILDVPISGLGDIYTQNLAVISTAGYVYVWGRGGGVWQCLKLRG